MPRLEYDVVFNLDNSSIKTLRDTLNDIESGGLGGATDEAKELNALLSRTAGSAEDVGNELSLSSSDMERFQNRTMEASTAMNRLADSTQRAGQDTRNMSKIANNSNQILFSFGDAIQDGAQFQHGFASGARAVGNNITFASEQIAIAINKTGSFTGAMKSLGASMLGPAGIIVGINTLVTLFTVLPNLFSDSEEGAKDLDNALSGLNTTISKTTSFVSELSSFDDPFGIESLRVSKESAQALTTEYETQLSRLKDIDSSLSDLKQSARDIRTETPFLDEEQEARIKEINKQTASLKSRREGIVSDFGTQSEIEEKIAKLKEEQRKIEQDINASIAAREGPLAQEARAREALNEAAMERAGADVIIPADISFGNIGQIQDQFRQAFLPSAGGELAIPSVVDGLIPLPELRQRIQEVEQEFRQVVSEEGFTTQAQQLGSQLNKLRNQQQSRTQDIAGELKKTSIQTNQTLLDIATNGIKATEDQAIAAEDSLNRISTIAGIAGQAVVTLFGKGKDAAIASAIVNGAQAITRTFAEFGYTPFGIGAAAAQAAITAAQISKIKSTEPGSSGGAGSSGSASGVTFSSSAANRERTTRKTFGERIDTKKTTQNNERQPIIIQGDINSVAAAFKIREGEAQIRKQERI